MRERQFGCVYNEMIHSYQVDVDDAVDIAALGVAVRRRIDGFLDSLKTAQKLDRLQVSVDSYAEIDKPIWRVEAPRL
jgi:hypothetical protein